MSYTRWLVLVLMRHICALTTTLSHAGVVGVRESSVEDESKGALVGVEEWPAMRVGNEVLWWSSDTSNRPSA